MSDIGISVGISNFVANILVIGILESFHIGAPLVLTPCVDVQFNCVWYDFENNVLRLLSVNLWLSTSSAATEICRNLEQAQDYNDWAKVCPYMVVLLLIMVVHV